jgi:hypothetical protein
VDKWINLTAIWQILVVGLLAGAGLPALVAVGLRVLSPGSGAGAGAGAGAGSVAVGRYGAALSCFAIVLAAIGYGIYLIVIGGH